MILRRIAEAFRRQDWFTVFVETMIVVLGVFLGLQVNNWNEARSERASEAIYLSNIVEDLRADQSEIEGIIDVAVSRMAALELLFGKLGDWRRPTEFRSSRGAAAIQGVAPFDEAQGNTIGGELFILNSFDGNRFTYEMLINTGGVGVIRDKSLVRDIQKYYAAVEQAQHFEESLEESRARLIEVGQRAGLAAIDATSAEALAASVKGDREFIAAAKNYWLYANRHITLIGALDEKAERLAERIEQERRR